MPPPNPQPAAQTERNPFKKPIRLVVREADGSCYLQMGEPNDPPFMAFDIYCDEKYAAFICTAANSHEKLINALKSSIAPNESALEKLDAICGDQERKPDKFRGKFADSIEGLKIVLSAASAAPSPLPPG